MRVVDATRQPSDLSVSLPRVLCRRELFARGAAAVGLFAAQSASAKAGQFGKVEIFSLIGQPAISSPYQAGGPKAGKDATFGYAKSDGPILATGYQARARRAPRHGPRRRRAPRSTADALVLNLSARSRT